MTEEQERVAAALDALDDDNATELDQADAMLTLFAAMKDGETVGDMIDRLFGHK